MILVRPFTEADDVAGFHAAKGILTSKGGKASHAALVARGMGKPCVAGAAALEIDLQAKTMRVDGTQLGGGRHDRDRRQRRRRHRRRRAARGAGDERGVRDRARLGRRAAHARRAGQRRHPGGRPPSAREFGAEGIGLCRSEHIFLAADRQQKMQAMIMAETEEERRRALDELLPLQQEHFEGLFEAMEGLPVTIRLLDPPLHEFIPNAEELAQEVERARIEESDDLEELEHTLERVHALAETNPMLGTRGVRLGVLHPEVYEMQMRAIVRAALAVRSARRAPRARDDGPAGGLRAGARADARAARAGGRGGGRRPTST